MRRIAIIIIAVLALAAIAAAPAAAARSFGRLYIDGDVYRTFGNPARVDPGTGTDPIYAFTNSTHRDQFSVARYAPGEGARGGRWMVFEATWTDEADRGILVTDYDTLRAYANQGRLAIVRNEGADFRCPILPNG
jgi:hypothetical protein